MSGRRDRNEEPPERQTPSEYRIVADEELRKAGTKIVQDRVMIDRIGQFTDDCETHITYDSPSQGIAKLRAKLTRVQRYLNTSTLPWLRAKNDRNAGVAIGAWQRLFAMTKVLVQEIEGYIGKDRRDEDGTPIREPSAEETNRWRALENAADILETADKQYKEETGKSLYSPQLRSVMEAGERTYGEYSQTEGFVSTPFINRGDLVETLIMFAEQEILSGAFTLAGVAWANQDVSPQETIVLHSTGAGQDAGKSMAPPRLDAALSGMGTNLGEQIEELNHELRMMREQREKKE